MNATPSIAPVATTDPVAVARALVPLWAERAANAEHLRCPIDPANQALLDAGLLRMKLPYRAGSAGHILNTRAEAVAMLARAWPGTAWTRMKTWLGIHWRDALLIAAIATSATLGYVSLYAWLIQLAAFQVQ